MGALAGPRPSPLLLVAGGLAAITLAVAWSPGAPPAATAPPSAARDLQFEDLADGGVRVRDAGSGAEIAILPPASNAFIRGALRALVRDRRLGAQPATEPFRLAAWPDGRLTLTDTATGRMVALDAFGATNAGAFGRLLTAGSGRP